MECGDRQDQFETHRCYSTQYRACTTLKAAAATEKRTVNHDRKIITQAHANPKLKYTNSNHIAKRKINGAWDWRSRSTTERSRPIMASGTRAQREDKPRNIESPGCVQAERSCDQRPCRHAAKKRAKLKKLGDIKGMLTSRNSWVSVGPRRGGQPPRTETRTTVKTAQPTKAPAPPIAAISEQD